MAGVEAVGGSFAAGFNGGHCRHVGRPIFRVKNFDVHFHQAVGRHAKIPPAAAPVHDHGDPDDVAVEPSDDVDGFSGTSAHRDHILNHEDFLALGDLEAAAEDEFALLLFGEDEAQSELPRDLLTDDEATHRRGDDRLYAQPADLVGERAAELLDH